MEQLLILIRTSYLVFELKLLQLVFMNFRILYRLVILLSLLTLISEKGWAKDWQKIKSVALSSPVMDISLDRYGMFYIADDDGNIYKYDTLGVLQLTFSPSRKADVTLIEAWRNVNIFVFYRSLQEYVLLDRFLAPSPNESMSETKVGYARLATFSYDNNIWLMDETDFSLKKYNTSSNEIDLNTPLDLLLDPSLYDLNYMREYQNLVFLNDKNSGVLIFDNMGNYKTKIPIKGLSFVGLYNDEIYYIEGDKIKFINIYTYVERNEPLPEKGDFQFILYTSFNLYLFQKSSVEVYKR
jgi:hypothetical protein